MKKRKISSRGIEFMTKQLAQARVDELKIYNRPATRIGKKVYEVFDWNK